MATPKASFGHKPVMSFEPFALSDEERETLYADIEKIIKRKLSDTARMRIVRLIVLYRGKLYQSDSPGVGNYLQELDRLKAHAEKLQTLIDNETGLSAVPRTGLTCHFLAQSDDPNTLHYLDALLAELSEACSAVAANMTAQKETIGASQKEWRDNRESSTNT